MAVQQLASQTPIASADPGPKLSGHVTLPVRGDAQLCLTPTAPRQDEELALKVYRALAAVDPGRLRSVSVKVLHGRVYLYGRVRTFYAKQIAQHTTMAIEGVERVFNELIVEQEQSTIRRRM